MATLNQIAEIVKNNVYAGLNSPSNFNSNQFEDQLHTISLSIFKMATVKTAKFFKNYSSIRDRSCRTRL